MVGSTEDGAVAEWHQLMLRWQAAMENYERILKANTTFKTRAETAPEMSLEFERAKTELIQIKREINSLVATSASRRGERSEPFIVGVVELNEDAFKDVAEVPKIKPKAVNS